MAAREIRAASFPVFLTKSQKDLLPVSPIETPEPVQVGKTLIVQSLLTTWLRWS